MKTDSTRKLIESNRDYLHLKNIIFHNMNVDGVTPWWDEEAWLDTVPQWSRNLYHRIVQDMLDDSEIEREYNREVIPNLTRWVMKDRKEPKK